MFEPEPVDPLLEVQVNLGLTGQEVEFLRYELNGFPLEKEFLAELCRLATGVEPNLGKITRLHINQLWADYFAQENSVTATELERRNYHLPSYHMHAVIDGIISSRLESTLEFMVGSYLMSQSVKSEELETRSNQLNIYDLTGLSQRAIKIITMLNFAGTLDDEGNRGKLPKYKSAMWAIEAGSRVALWGISNMIVSTNELGVDVRGEVFLDSIEMIFRRMMNANINLVAPHQQYLALSPDRGYLEDNFILDNGTCTITIKPGSALDLAIFFSRNSVQESASEFREWISAEKARQLNGNKIKQDNQRVNGIDQIHENYWVSLLGLPEKKKEKLSDPQRLAFAKSMYLNLIEQNANPADYTVEAFFDHQLGCYYVRVNPRDSVLGPRPEPIIFNLIQVSNRELTSGCPFRFTTMEYFKILSKRLPNLIINSVL